MVAQAKVWWEWDVWLDYKDGHGSILFFAQVNIIVKQLMGF